jgi:hypothetical protein
MYVWSAQAGGPEFTAGLEFRTENLAMPRFIETLLVRIKSLA